MFECCKRIWHWVRQATGKQKCHSPGKVSLRQPLPGYGGEGWKVCCMQAAALALSLPPCYSPRALALCDCSHGLGSHERGPPSTALKLTPLPSWIKQLMVLCHLFSPARCSSPSFLPQVLSSRCSLRSPSPQVSCYNTTSPMWHHWASQGAEGVISTSSVLPNTPIQMAVF